MPASAHPTPGGVGAPRRLGTIAAVLSILSAATVLVVSEFDRTDERSTFSLIAVGTCCVLMSLACLALVGDRRRLRAHLADTAAQQTDSEDLNRRTIDLLVDGVVVQDENGRVLHINEAGRAIIASHMNTGAPAAGEHFADSLPQMVDEDCTPIPPEQRIGVRALAGDEPVVGSVLGLPGQNGVTWFRCNAAATPARADGSRRVVVTFSDVTSERSMADQIRDQERRFRSALEQAPIGVALVSAEGRLMRVNRTLSQLTGRAEHEMLERGLRGLTHELERAFGIDELVTLGSDETGDTPDSRYLSTADGSFVSVRPAVATVKPGGGAEPYHIVNFVDVTELERALAANADALAGERDAVAELQSLDHIRTTFVSTISHELRTPLTSMLGYLELLEDGAAGTLTDSQLEMMAPLVRNGERLALLIDNLLGLFAAEKPVASSEHGPVYVSTLLHGVIETIAPLAATGEVGIACGFVGSNVIVAGDRGELDRVLMNIVGNAVKFTPSGGSVSMSAVQHLDDPWPHVVIRVADTGVGVPADQQHRLFERFFRSKNAQENHIQGTGLGLSIAAQLVEAHDGTIKLTSVENRGTTVVIKLPVETAAAEVSELAS